MPLYSRGLSAVLKMRQPEAQRHAILPPGDATRLAQGCLPVRVLLLYVYARLVEGPGDY